MKADEEWVDGSWSVDCVCGVNYDDGKEMVNCDECGVWVHTWCCGYVKGGDDLFACHKCNSSKIKTKDDTVRIEDNVVGPSRSYKTEIPIEERVHVQGVPGGDVTIFEYPSIFSRQLWKCTGYVPKKFRVQYNEFSCWDDDKGNVNEIVGQPMSSKDDNVAFAMRSKGRKRANDTRSWGFGDSQSVVISKDKCLLANKMRKELLGGSEDGVQEKVKVAD